MRRLRTGIAGYLLWSALASLGGCESAPSASGLGHSGSDALVSGSGAGLDVSLSPDQASPSPSQDGSEPVDSSVEPTPDVGTLWPDLGPSHGADLWVADGADVSDASGPHVNDAQTLDSDQVEADDAITVSDVAADNGAMSDTVASEDLGGGATDSVGSLADSTSGADLVVVSSDAWTHLPHFPGASRRHPVTFALGSDLYVAGGLYFDPLSGWVELDELWVYRSLGGFWQARQSMPGGAQAGNYAWTSTPAAVVTVEGGAYLQRGAETWRYDPAVDQWTVTGGFPGDTELSPQLFSDGESLYAGLGGHSELQFIGGYNLNVTVRDKRVYRLDLGSMTWSYDTSYQELATVAYTVSSDLSRETTFITRGGSNQHWPVFILDHETMNLRQGPTLLFDLDNVPACVTTLEGQVIVAGHDTRETDLVVDAHEERIWRLNASLELWEPLVLGPLEELRGDLQGPACAAIGDTFYTGLGYTTPHAPPAPGLGQSVTHLGAGDLFSAAVMDSGGVVTWGWRSQWPLTGFELSHGIIRDLDVRDTAVAVVDEHGMMFSDGDCLWGGQDVSPPTLAGHFDQVEISCHSALGLTTDGQLVGVSAFDYLDDLTLPDLAPGAAPVSISLGTYGSFALVLDSTGRVHVIGDPWGAIDPLPPETQQGITAVATGSEHALALTDSGQVIAWGSSGYGADEVPANLPGPTVAIDADEDLSAALSASGVLTCWGWLCENYLVIPDELQRHIAAFSLGPENILLLLDDGTLRDVGNVRGKGPNVLMSARKL